MKSKTEEILTFDIYKKKNIFEIHIPVQNLFNPKFLLKQDSLMIYLSNYTRCYLLKNIPKDVINDIKEEKVLINEKNLDAHIIKLAP